MVASAGGEQHALVRVADVGVCQRSKEAPGTTALLKTLPSEVLADILLDSA